MRNLGKSNQICDGVVDCPDFSDKLYCPYCPEHNFHFVFGDTHFPNSTMKIMFRTVWTVKFVREIWTINNSITNLIFFTQISHLMRKLKILQETQMTTKLVKNSDRKNIWLKVLNVLLLLFFQVV